MLLTFAFGELLFSVVWKIKWFQTPGIEACIGLPRSRFRYSYFVWTAT